MRKLNIVREGEIRGYQEQLPIRKNDIVTIRKGTIIRRTYEGYKRAGRTYNVPVNHTLCGRSICIGHYWPTEDHLGMYRIEGKYLDPFEQVYGTRDLMDLIFYVIPKAEYTNDGTLYYALYVPIENPQVCWPGSGGYWMDVEINDVEKVEKK